MSAPKPWDHPWTMDEMIDHSDTWTLACDVGLLNTLKQFADTMLKTCNDCNDNIGALGHQIEETGLRLRIARNNFQGLRNTQFIESRVYEDDIEEAVPRNTPLEPKKTTEENDSTGMIKAAALTGLDVIGRYFDRVEVDVSDNDSDEEQVSQFVLRARDLYVDRPLPHVIGSEDWYRKSHVGLLDSDEESEQIDDDVDSDSSSSEADLDNSSDHANRDVEIIKGSAISDSTGSYTSDLTGDPLGDVINTRPLARPIRPSLDLFFDEPPPLDDDTATRQLSKTDLFSGTSRGLFDDDDDVIQGPPAAAALKESSDEDDDELFAKLGGGDGVKKTILPPFKASGFEAAPLFSAEPPELKVEQPDKKKPAGGVSIFGGIIDKDLLKKQRHDSSDDDNDVTDNRKNIINLFDDDESDLHFEPPAVAKATDTDSANKGRSLNLFDSSSSDEEIPPITKQQNPVSSQKKIDSNHGDEDTKRQIPVNSQKQSIGNHGDEDVSAKQNPVVVDLQNKIKSLFDDDDEEDDLFTSIVNNKATDNLFGSSPPPLPREVSTNTIARPPLLVDESSDDDDDFFHSLDNNAKPAVGQSQSSGLFGSSPPSNDNGGGLFGSSPPPIDVITAQNKTLRSDERTDLFGSTVKKSGGGLFGTSPPPIDVISTKNKIRQPEETTDLFASTVERSGGGLFGTSPPPIDVITTTNKTLQPEETTDLFSSTVKKSGGGLFGTSPPPLDVITAPIKTLQLEKTTDLFGTSPPPLKVSTAQNKTLYPEETRDLFDSSPLESGGGLFGSSPPPLDVIATQNKTLQQETTTDLFDSPPSTARTSERGLFGTSPPSLGDDKTNDLFGSSPPLENKTLQLEKTTDLFASSPPPLDETKDLSDSSPPLDVVTSQNKVKTKHDPPSPPPTLSPAISSKINDLSQGVDVTDKVSPPPRSVGKLKHNLKINVGALRPGYVPPKRGSDHVVAVVADDSSTDICNTDDDVQVLHSVTKDRAKLRPFQRRPSTRRGRQSALRNSANLDFKLGDESSPSLDDVSKTVDDDDDSASSLPVKVAEVTGGLFDDTPSLPVKVAEVTPVKVRAVARGLFDSEPVQPSGLFDSTPVNVPPQVTGGLFASSSSVPVKVPELTTGGLVDSSSSILENVPSEVTGGLFDNTSSVPVKVPELTGGLFDSSSSPLDKVTSGRFDNTSSVPVKVPELTGGLFDSPSSPLVKVTSGLFDNTSSPPAVKVPEVTKGLFDDDGDLFGGAVKKTVTSVTRLSGRSKVSLFDDDDDDDDDLFKSAVDVAKVTAMPGRSSGPKKFDPVKTKPADDDPLSDLLFK